MPLRTPIVNLAGCAKAFLKIHLATIGSTLLVYGLLGHRSGFVYLWPVTAVQLGLLQRAWNFRTERIAGICGGAAGTLLGCSMAGLPPWFAVCIALVSALDVWLAGTILERSIFSFEDLKRRENLWTFARAVTIPPVLASLLMAFPLYGFLHEHVLRAFLLSALSDSLGMVVVLPPLLMCPKGRNCRKITAAELRSAIAPAAAFVAVAVLVFSQNRYPLLFLVFPAMISLLLTAGLEGAVFASITLSIIACVATSHGHGPFWLAQITMPVLRVLMLQAFLWLSVAVALPVGALLDEQRRTRRELIGSYQRFEAFMDRSPMAAYIKDTDGRMRYYNRRIADLYRISRQEWMGKLDHEIWPEEAAAAFRAADLAVLAGNHDLVLEESSPQPDGGTITWKSYKFPFRDEDGQCYIAGVSIDVSREKIFEAELRESEAKLRKAVAELEQLSLTDPLTQIGNRRYFDDKLELSVAQARELHSPLSVIMLDIDHFKQLNDRYGHAYGDEVLQWASARLRTLVRSTDHLCRYGGEEFAIVLEHTPARLARQIGERICAELRAETYRECAITVSIGIAEYRGGSQAAADLIGRADKALYRAKRDGRNRVVMAEVRSRLHAVAS